MNLFRQSRAKLQETGGQLKRKKKNGCHSFHAQKEKVKFSNFIVRKHMYTYTYLKTR